MKMPVRAALGCVCILSLLVTRAWAVGESAVITLVFPPGARATGLGETFVAVADDANATFFNPAGLGQAPLANSWRLHKTEKGATFTAVAAKRRKDFGRRERVWAGTTEGLLRYNGKVWESYETYVIEKEDDLFGIAEKFIYADDEKLIQQAVKVIKDANDIDRKRSAAIRRILDTAVVDSSAEKKEALIEVLTNEILELDQIDQNATKIYGLIAVKVDSARADTLAAQIADVFDIPDTRFEDLVELKIPFDIAVHDSVSALAVDAQQRLWVGTARGLWNYDGKSWNYYSVLDGLPSNMITSVAIGPNSEIAIGTDRGVGLLAEGRWQNFSIDAGLPDSLISAVAFGSEGALWAGTAEGLARKDDTAWTVFDTTDGLLAKGVTALMYDSEENLWIGGQDGVTVYTETAWKRYKFPDSRVHCFAEQRTGRVWIGTNKGAVSYKAGRSRTDREGKKIVKPPTWKAYHSKNALKGNNVVGLTVHGKDIWLATDEAVNQYDRADMEFLFFYEPILPAFGITDLWHIYSAYVLPTEDWGTIGISFNYLNFGVNTWTDELGRELGEARSWEGVLGISYGLPIKEDLSFGLNIKYVHSA
ncbi:MAG: hypothetical protein GF418_06260, partial [Chitinivibrionales bacterium]|nr:hypothetical protein [Chitinivibrionales bacterium]MBD3395214.1 hypothetical protein [Chitinivibrionales bacterium]